MSSSSSEESSGEERPKSIEPYRKLSDQTIDKLDASSDVEIEVKKKKPSFFKKLWNAIARKKQRRQKR